MKPKRPRDVHVWLICHRCGHRWLGAILTPYEPTTEATIAKRCYCPRCQAPPPMRLAGEAEQQELF